ncbi:MAG: 5-(carboxyamino)imidazole ribonucleotide synthase [Leptospiraceae bacterium]|nr:5-(carboxyamino)imidazole ribonucleotide synthase [Leptospiraceae bacterium]MDW7976899.1 5-(carboxyamino)imidazole ribonucleotide synthase [Leptospiraceae bacterium]
MKNFKLKKTIGIIGGGQLGRMMAYEAYKMGFFVYVLDPDPDAPAMQICHKPIVASYDDEGAIFQMVKECDVITYEFENVNPELLLEFRKEIPIHPNPEILKISKNRNKEKELAHRYGISIPKIFPIRTVQNQKESIETLYHELRKTNIDWIIKTAEGGYDGKFQIFFPSQTITLSDFEQKLSEIFRAFKKDTIEIIIEERLNFSFEFSVISCGIKDQNGNYRIEFFHPFINYHKDGILRKTFLSLQKEVQFLEELQNKITQLMRDFDYIGLLTIEFFYKENEIFFNEMAPRPHNSGHLTIEAYDYSQFHQHVRAISKLPVHKPKPHSYAGMLNLVSFNRIDEQPYLVEEILKYPKTYFHYYGKKEAKQKRKMGHITVLQSEFHHVQTIIEELERKIYAHEFINQ